MLASPGVRGLPLACLVALLSCRADDDPVDPEGKWRNDYATAACTAIFDNECDCASFENFYGSQAECESVNVLAIRQVQANANKTGAVFDRDCAYEHVDTIENLSCESEAELAAAGSKATCPIYSGDKALDESCQLLLWASSGSSGNWVSNCAPGLLCAPEQRCVTPEKPYVELGPGDACRDQDDRPLGRCPAPQLCDVATTKTCVTPAALGEPCLDDYPCVDSWCDAGTCVAPKPNGSPCESSNECAAGNRCDEDEGCVELVPYAAACFAIAL